MSPYFFRYIKYTSDYNIVEVVIGDANDDNFSLTLRLNATDFVNAFTGKIE